jgi:protein gp37
MAAKSNIEWTNATWNPWHGCHKVSAGCKNCYMFAEKRRYGQNPDVVVRSKTTFGAPLRWKEPKLVFTCSWSDFFIEEADLWRIEAYDIMRATPHTYQVLTKRIERALCNRLQFTPIPNMWLGVSVENRAAKIRIEVLREANVALRFLSVEPLLEDIGGLDLRGIGWVIVGGESGTGARAFNIEWARRIVAQCKEQGVPCFVKQLGAFPILNESGMKISVSDRKGGDAEEWPLDLRVREMPLGYAAGVRE